MSDGIRNVAALESCIGKTPGPMHLKVIDHLDAGAIRWLAASPLMFAGSDSATDTAVSIAGGKPGFIDVVDASRMRLPKAYLDRSDIACWRNANVHDRGRVDRFGNAPPEAIHLAAVTCCDTGEAFRFSGNRLSL